VPPESLPWDAGRVVDILGEGPVGQAVAEAGRALGSVLAHLVAILDLHDVVLAIELAGVQDALLVAVREEVRGRLLPTLASAAEFVASEHGEDLVLTGAAALVLGDRLGVVWQ
jgi:predicted NBD/HSP70 family sugar kinase